MTETQSHTTWLYTYLAPRYCCNAFWCVFSIGGTKYPQKFGALRRKLAARKRQIFHAFSETTLQLDSKYLAVTTTAECCLSENGIKANCDHCRVCTLN